MFRQLTEQGTQPSPAKNLVHQFLLYSSSISAFFHEVRFCRHRITGLPHAGCLTCSTIGVYPIPMGDAPPINLSPELIDYGLQKFLKLFGQDIESKELANWFRGLQETGLTQTSKVRCLGMLTALPFDAIYQPTRILVCPDENESTDASAEVSYQSAASVSIIRGLKQLPITIDEFLKRDEDAVILGGPGWGKTTFLHRIFRTMAKHEDVLPVLITLRRPTAVDDLERYVDACSRIQKKKHRACTLLLVDGYDEIGLEHRVRVTEALLKFQAGRAGKFYLTCREYYELPPLNAQEVRLDCLTRTDQVKFVKVFLANFAIMRDDPEIVVSQLEARGFKEFLSHPLLLTLACIVRTSSTSVQPRSALRLLDRALEILTLQWDEHRHIDRRGKTPLEGTDRVRLLKKLAYATKSPFIERHRAEEISKRQLVRLGYDKVDPRTALVEIARFYGILVPAEDGYEFAHRTIHDFLAAKQWVESGSFATCSRFDWDARTGYAACLVDDATKVLLKALDTHQGLPTITEIIGNHAGFDFPVVADAIIKHFYQHGRVLSYNAGDQSVAARARFYAPRIMGQLSSEFIRLANSEFLDFIVAHCCERKTTISDLLVAYAVTELYARLLKLKPATYKKVVAAYQTDVMIFSVPGAKETQLKLLNPELENRMKDYTRPAQKPPTQ